MCSWDYPCAFYRLMIEFWCWFSKMWDKKEKENEKEKKKLETLEQTCLRKAISQNLLRWILWVSCTLRNRILVLLDPHSTPLSLEKSQRNGFSLRMSIPYRRPYRFSHRYDIFRIPVNIGVSFRVYRYFLYLYIYIYMYVCMYVCVYIL